jgi:hypothetical protein
MWSTNLLVTLGGAKIPRAHEGHAGLAGYSRCCSLPVTRPWRAIFGVVGAYAASRAGGQLAKVVRPRDDGAHVRRIRDGLVVVEVSLAFILAVGAALVARRGCPSAFRAVRIVTENVLTLHLTPRAEAGDYYAIEQRVAALTAYAAPA